MKSLALVLACVSLAAVTTQVHAQGPAEAEALPELSFQGPFEAFNAEGDRILETYMHGGSADIKKNYVRLTPDRAVSV
jgi:hypothetical protein